MAFAASAVFANAAIGRRAVAIARGTTLPRSHYSSSSSPLSSRSAVVATTASKSLSSSSSSSSSSSTTSATRKKVDFASSSRSPVRWMTTYYTPAHEYCKVEGKIATVGITDFAQAALGDIVFVDLPAVDDAFDAGDSFGSVESVKAASDVYAPVSGRVVEANGALSDEPGLVNTEAEGGAWFVKLEMTGNLEEFEKLMNEEEYRAHCEKEAH